VRESRPLPSLGAALAVALAVVAAGCGGPHQPRRTTVLTVFRVHGGTLRAERAEVPAARSTPAAALGALGLHVPVNVARGTAHVSIDTLSPDRIAEVVYTLTGLDGIRRVDVAGRSGLVRADVVRYVPAILVESPAAGQRVPTTFAVSGTASVFEATLVIELRRRGMLIERRTVTATAGAPSRGTFRATLHAGSTGPATVIAFAPSAADGTPQHVQRVGVKVS
jgi:hypothetical protein